MLPSHQVRTTMEGTMKRIGIGMLFAGALIAAGVLRTGASGEASPVTRTVVTAVIATLVLWKVVDFIQRHRGSAPVDESASDHLPGDSRL